GAGFDVSQSMSREQKQRSVAFLNKLIGTVLPTRTPVKIWRYAESLETVHESRPIASKQLTKVSRETIENYLGKWGTRPDKVMQEFQRYIQQQPDRKAVLCLFTDGECHSAQETRMLAQQLAQNSQVVAVVVGPVLNKYRASVENDYYAPLRDTGKLFVFGETDALDALGRVKEHLHSFRN
ncbi:MAG: VWA domain-containing protein, partial [Fimbriimonadales bacterium]|nr:VWA domain-containing protein [Fimbriimonadales bacterium]